MEFTAGSSSSAGLGGAASFIAGSSSSGDDGSLTLESGDWSTTVGSIAVNGGSGEKSLGGSVTIESRHGGDRFGFGFRVRLAFEDAGFAGVSGGLSLSTGIATDGDSGAVVISSGSLAWAQSHSRLG
jgi:hypothetical protein